MDGTLSSSDGRAKRGTRRRRGPSADDTTREGEEEEKTRDSQTKYSLGSGDGLRRAAESAGAADISIFFGGAHVK